MFLVVVNVAFLIAGMFIDPNSALLILIPPLFPVATQLGIDPVHFGMIVTLNICIGMITPPFGLDIFVASSTLSKPVTTIVSGVWPFIVANLVALLIVTYVPPVSLFLPTSPDRDEEGAMTIPTENFRTMASPGVRSWETGATPSRRQRRVNARLPPSWCWKRRRTCWMPAAPGSSSTCCVPQSAARRPIFAGR